VTAAALPPLSRREKEFLAGLQPAKPPCQLVTASVLSLESQQVQCINSL
jgi:hypothetical protein